MMNFLGNLLGSLLKLVYDLVSAVGLEPDNVSYYAIAVIITTILFKLILLPVSFQQNKSTKKMKEIQPMITEIQTKYKSDPQTQQMKIAEVYKEHKYNPMSGCLVLLVQMPIILSFFKVMREPVPYAFKDPAVYEAISKNFLWIPTLENPDPLLWGLPLLAAATTYLQSITMSAAMPSEPQAQATQRMMNIFLPIMIFMAARNFPAGLGLYWVIGNIFTIVQQLITNRSMDKVKEEN